MGFTKLDSGILDSSVWSYPSEIRCVWIALLAMADEEGFVASSLSGLVRRSNEPEDVVFKAISLFESPDSDSRTTDYDGRRIQKVDGGWLIMNYLKYRAKTDRDFHKEKMRRYRTRCSTTNGGCSTTVVLPSASASASEKEEKSPEKGRRFVPPTLEEVSAYCLERGGRVDPQKWLDHYASNGWKVGRNPMRDWKAAVRTWERSEFNSSPTIVKGKDTSRPTARQL